MVDTNWASMGSLKKTHEVGGGGGQRSRTNLGGIGNDYSKNIQNLKTLIKIFKIFKRNDI